ncbi:hypothetical protein Hypma_008945 [Hypsizygus marmoreus]|uniref:HAUS augmin-like complex subunit 6 N-terminal domain-containing protein n=1 Tax=Hypsizygus marmoreus TaxID=39966 RepID=A0A369JNL7_HYPMA|nr:hypothetical protein Hypma_008945 [Hypsizygus marmoreus]
MSASSVLSLPIPLILLVHLHILEYPHANKPEYDHNIFESRVRGLRDRTKLLEDVCYFLVGRLEGSSSNRTILPTYPCLAPSDTVAFRTSLAKYLETLRHDSLYPSSKAPALANGKVKVKNDGTAVAWWWKDVLVRKSLLEECAGEKFERLLLSVSTHALLRGTLSPIAVVPENTYDLLRSQPTAYADLLAKCKSARRAWSHSASLLLQRQEDLRALREHLKSPTGSAPSKYASLPTNRLVALTNSKHQDLLRRIWLGHNGRRALDFLTKLSGIDDGSGSDSTTLSEPLSVMSTAQLPTILPQPLPVAAAHHPGNLKKLRKPIFASTKQKPAPPTIEGAEAVMKPGTRNFAKIALADRVDAEARTHQALADALVRLRKVGEGLVLRKRRLDETLLERKGVQPLNLWQPQRGPPVDFDTQPTPDLLSSLCLDIPEPESLEARIDHVREHMLTSYPPIPDLSAPRVPASVPEQPPPKTGSSKIPHSIKAGHARARTPEHEPHLLTSTPPPTVRPHHHQAGNKDNNTKKEGARLKMPRKSIRFSLAVVNRRPSLFATGNALDEEDVFENDVDRIVHGTLDTSTSSLSSIPMTPKGRTPKPNRIFTGTRTKTFRSGGGGSTVKKQPKKSYPIVFEEPRVGLPSLLGAGESFDALFGDGDGSEDEDDWGGAGWGKRKDGEEGGGEEYVDEAPSMTLRDILLSADTTQFDLLDDEAGEDGMRQLAGIGEEEDASFEWA